MVASNRSGNVLLPDLAFNFVCEGKPRFVLEREVENWLSNNGFRTLNVRKMEERRGISMERVLIDILIDGLDGKHRIVEFLTTLPPPNSDARHRPHVNSVSLVSSPPTQHSASMEAALLAFVKDKLKCDVRQVSRNQNGPEAIEFYKSEINRIEGLFRQAEELQGRKRT